MTQHQVAAEKKQAVESMVRLVQESPVIAVLNLENLPAPQMQSMKAKLRDSVVLFTTKKRLMKIALESAKEQKPGVEQLIARMRGMPSLLFTKDNPFRLAAVLRQSKSRAPAKPGQTAPYDIVIPAGPTPFAPGPVISELGSVGLKTGVENGKVTIREDAVVAEEGEVISENVAKVLAKLGITPMEIGLDLVAAYEDGVIFGRDVLSVDPQTYRSQLAAAAAEALALSMSLGYVTSYNVVPFLQKAYRQARHLSVEYTIISDELMKVQLGRAALQMEALKAKLGLPDVGESEEKTAAAAEEKKEETKAAVNEETKQQPQKPVVREEKNSSKRNEAAAAEEEIEKQIEDMKAEAEAKDPFSTSPETITKLADELRKKGTLRGNNG